MSEKLTRKAVFKDVAKLRLDDASQLLKEKRFNGAIYLLGYAIECHLKFAVCERNEWNELPEKIPQGGKQVNLYVHNWDVLVEAAQLRPLLNRKPLIFAAYSAMVEQWGPSLRYRTKLFSKTEGHRLYKQLEELYQFFRESVP